MLPRVSTWIRVGVKLLDESNFKGGFFFGFPNGSGFQALSIVDKTSG
jgi:hypothetical protein